MIDLFELYEESCGTFNTAQGGIIRPNRNFVSWVNTISLKIFKDLYKEFQTSQVITDELYIFLRSANAVVTGIPGQKYDVVKLSDDYKYFANAHYRSFNAEPCGIAGCETICEDLDADEKAFRMLDKDSAMSDIIIDKITTNRWDAHLSRKTLNPRTDKSGMVKNPACTQFDGGLKLAPKNMGLIVIEYFRMPAAGTFDYTILNPGEETEYIQYNADASKKLEWSATMRPEFIAQLKMKYAAYIQNPEMYAQANNELSKM